MIRKNGGLLRLGGKIPQVSSPPIIFVFGQINGDRLVERNRVWLHLLGHALVGAVAVPFRCKDVSVTGKVIRDSSFAYERDPEIALNLASPIRLEDANYSFALLASIG